MVSHGGTSWLYHMVVIEVSNCKLCRIIPHFLGPLRGPIDVSHYGISLIYVIKVSHQCIYHQGMSLVYLINVYHQYPVEPPNLNRIIMGYLDQVL